MAAKKYYNAVGGQIITTTGQAITFGPDNLLETSDPLIQKGIEAVASCCAHVYEVKLETVAPVAKPVA